MAPSATDKVYANGTEVQDAEKGNVNISTKGSNEDLQGGERPLQRQLKSRHIQMISIGGVIGTGLFIGTGRGLAHGGPLGLLLGFSVVGTIVFSVMVALGELIAHLPVPGGHISLAKRFVDDGFAYAMGWQYMYTWLLALPAELSAAATIIAYWDSSISVGVWITVGLVFVIGIQCMGTKAYGETEFWFAIIKVLTILGLIILGIVIDAGGGPNHEPIGFRYWRNPGPFVQYLGIPGVTGRFLGFWSVLIQAAFSYIGTEIVAIAAGEAANPKKTLPSAIKKVYIRIVFFYVLGTFVIGLLISSADDRLGLGTGNAASSPFVIAMQDSGIRSLPSIINACLLTAAWSAASSDLYTGSRAVYGMALQGHAPRVFIKVTKSGLPWVAVMFGSLFAFLSYTSLSSGAGKNFGYLSGMTSCFGVTVWAGICFTYIRFYNAMKRQGFDRATLPYRAPLQPYLSYYALVFCIVILIFNGFTVFIKGNWDTATFVTSYIPVIMFPILWLGYRFGYKRSTRFVNLDEVDLVSGSRVEGDDEYELEQQDKPKKNFIHRAWNAVM